jgi:hypothetical protein
MPSAPLYVIRFLWLFLLPTSLRHRRYRARPALASAISPMAVARAVSSAAREGSQGTSPGGTNPRSRTASTLETISQPIVLPAAADFRLPATPRPLRPKPLGGAGWGGRATPTVRPPDDNRSTDDSALRGPPLARLPQRLCQDPSSLIGASPQGRGVGNKPSYLRPPALTRKPTMPPLLHWCG